MQNGALACLDPEGLAEIDKLIAYYMGNAKILRDCMLELGYKVHGGTDAPYVFVDLEGRSSRRRTSTAAARGVRGGRAEVQR